MKRFLIATTAVVATAVAIEKMIDWAVNYKDSEDEGIDLSKHEDEHVEPTCTEDNFDEFRPFKEFSDSEFKGGEFEYKDETKPCEEECEETSEAETPDFLADVLDETNKVMKELKGKAKEVLKSIPSVEITVNVKSNKDKEN